MLGAREIVEVVATLAGSPFKNIDTWIEVADKLLDAIWQVSKADGGEKATNALSVWGEWINECVGED